MSSECKLCMVAMDEMWIKESLICSVERDEVVGYEELAAEAGPSTLPTLQLLFLSGALQPSGSNRLVIFSAVGQ